MRRWIRFGCALAFAALPSAVVSAADWTSELPSAVAVRRTARGADTGPRLEAAFATLCDYVDVRNERSKVMPPRARALVVEYKCRQRRHPVSPEVIRHFESPVFRREVLTSFISPASFEIYVASSPVMRDRASRTDRE